jgi:phosphoglycolate phosphatase
MIRLVIFDLDGTLIDSLADLGTSMNAVLARAGWSTHPLDAYRHFVGDGVANLVRRALPAALRADEEAVARHLAEMREEYDRRWLDQTRPYPGIAAMLRELSERGVGAAVFSNKPDPATQHLVRVLFPGYPFLRVRGARPDTPLKPDPAGAVAILAETGIPAAATLYVGDTDTDMRTGRAAGLRTLGVSWGFRPVEELLAHGAASVLQHPRELADHLSRHPLPEESPP